ncbi:HAD-IIIC family phosphatase [Sinorhizobium sp. NFACC03]|uniref:HAD-IIIC family phosphatase n=1 Tax=Sinorhizobium sp. NFACC03 TaxID=1566295 RepID=UPI00088E7720|nr:HAD-IIIC family phosphatase [Sinorhizobium sp. NFACC03]SDA70689.1 HAD-superfamily phosphatase, subfamily IIIC/FkbH-like domain-containing protein [Sinorhizobium sp. NFACC03]
MIEKISRFLPFSSHRKSKNVSVADLPASADTIEFLFQALLNRPVGNDEFKNGMDRKETVRWWIDSMIHSDEFRHLFAQRHGFAPKLPEPAQSLSASAAPPRLLLLGTCGVGPLVQIGNRLGLHLQHQLATSHRYDGLPDLTTDGFDAAVFFLTLRHLLADATGLPLNAADMAVARLSNDQELDALVQSCGELISNKLSSLSSISQRIPLFIPDFFEPSFDYTGMVLPGDRVSYKEFIRKLNDTLSKLMRSHDNLIYVDTNEIVNFIGRMHFQDDISTHATHNAFIADAEGFHRVADDERVAPSRLPSEVWQIDAFRGLYGKTFLNKIKTDLAILRAEKPIKLIIVDLDDTLWRGVAAEEDRPLWERTEGWPVGFVEALLYFKSRGGLLAVASKNDRDPTLERLKMIWQGAITAEDFASMKINWNSKSENIAEILRETNILPQNALFIDDNPREIDEVRARFPDMRFLNENHYDWRRIVLQAPETRVARITEESARRTEMVQARVERLDMERQMSREDWLRSLQLEQQLFIMDIDDKPRFERGFELINKTNQFNTTGKRWELSEFKDFLAAGGVCLLSSLRDKTGDNGITGAALVKDGEIVQAVLSCRVFGLGAEVAMGSAATKIALSQADRATGMIIDTGKNLTCHGWFKSLGFTDADGHFETVEACETPEWIKVS